MISSICDTPILVDAVVQLADLRVLGFMFQEPGRKTPSFISEESLTVQLICMKDLIGSDWHIWWNWPSRKVVIEFHSEGKKASFPIWLLMPEEAHKENRLIEISDRATELAFGLNLENLI